MLDVMDYSLLVGFDRDRHELVVGVIDYIRQYTWDKQVESWVKKSGILGGAGKEPTIISPRQYRRRFLASVLTYFTVVPSLVEPLSALDIEST
jgi:1-phosphatidylinositol-3-phosphate 5-kinase